MPVQIWGFLSNVGMFRYEWGFLVHLYLIDWKTYFLILQELLQYFYIFFRFCWLFVKTFGVFELLRQIWRFLSNVGIFRDGWGFLVHLNLIDWKTHFSIIQKLLWYFNIFFRFCQLFVKNFEVFELLGQNWAFLSNVGMFRYGPGFLVHPFVFLFFVVDIFVYI